MWDRYRWIVRSTVNASIRNRVYVKQTASMSVHGLQLATAKTTSITVYGVQLAATRTASISVHSLQKAAVADSMLQPMQVTCLACFSG